jgi:hypothetical protein
MKHYKSLTLAALLALCAGESFADSGSHTVPVYYSNGGKKLNVDNNGTLEVLSGGVVKLDSGSAVTGPAPTACGATCSVANVGGFTLLNLAAGSTATLPAATGTGNSYKLLVTVTTTSAAEKILTNPTTDTIIGTAQGENAGTSKVFVGNASTYHSIQMPFAGTQPSGGFAGDEVECTDVATGVWECNVMYQAGTTPTTPYSASTS